MEIATITAVSFRSGALYLTELPLFVFKIIWSLNQRHAGLTEKTMADLLFATPGYVVCKKLV